MNIIKGSELLTELQINQMFAVKFRHLCRPGEELSGFDTRTGSKVRIMLNSHGDLAYYELSAPKNIKVITVESSIALSNESAKIIQERENQTVQEIMAVKSAFMEAYAELSETFDIAKPAKVEAKPTWYVLPRELAYLKENEFKVEHISYQRNAVASNKKQRAEAAVRELSKQYLRRERKQTDPKLLIGATYIPQDDVFQSWICHFLGEKDYNVFVHQTVARKDRQLLFWMDIQSGEQ